MTVSTLALYVVCGAGKPFECPDEVEGKLAKIMIQLAGIKLGIQLSANIFLGEGPKCQFMALNSSSPFSVNELLGAIHTVAADLFKWTPVSIQEVRNHKGFSAQPLLSHNWDSPVYYMTQGSANNLKADFYDLVLKHCRKIRTASDICSFQHNDNHILLIGNKNTIYEVMDIFRRMLNLSSFL